MEDKTLNPEDNKTQDSTKVEIKTPEIKTSDMKDNNSTKPEPEETEIKTTTPMQVAAQPTQEPEVEEKENNNQPKPPLDPNLAPPDKKELEQQAKKTIKELSPGSSSKNVTMIIIALLLIAILALAGFWLYSKGLIPGLQSVTETTPAETAVSPAPSASPEEDDMTQQLLNQNSSDEVSSIEQDLNNTDLNNVDKELTEIEQELQTP